jgi:hypothetical protein
VTWRGEMERALEGVLNSKNRVKRVQASDQVLQTYHESFLYGKVSPSVKVRGTLRAGWVGLSWYFVCSRLLTPHPHPMRNWLAPAWK